MQLEQMINDQQSTIQRLQQEISMYIIFYFSFLFNLKLFSFQGISIPFFYS